MAKIPIKQITFPGLSNTVDIVAKNELLTDVNAFASKWILNYNITSNGTIGTNQYSAFTPMFYDAD